MEKQGLTQKVKSPQFEVLKKIQEGLTISEIAKYRKTSRVSVYKIIKTLINKGHVNKISNGVYGLTDLGTEGLHSFVQLRYALRQHNLNFKIKILNSPKNWDKKRHSLTQLPYFNKSIKLKNNEQELFNFGKVNIRTTTKSVIVKIPTIYSKTTEEAVIQSFNCLYEIIPKIEKLFSISLIKDYKANITIISNEYASLNDTLAKIYQMEGNNLLVTDELGKVWMITDLSFSNSETEFIDSTKSIDDVDAVMPMLNDLRKNPTTFKEVLELAKEQQKQLNQITENQLIFDKNMSSHLKVLKDINEAINLLKQEVIKLNDKK